MHVLDVVFVQPTILHPGNLSLASSGSVANDESSSSFYHQSASASAPASGFNDKAHLSSPASVRHADMVARQQGRCKAMIELDRLKPCLSTDCLQHCRAIRRPLPRWTSPSPPLNINIIATTPFSIR